LVQYNGVYELLPAYYLTMDALAQLLIEDFLKVTGRRGAEATARLDAQLACIPTLKRIHIITTASHHAVTQVACIRLTSKLTPHAMQVNGIQLVVMGVEGICLCAFVCVYMYILLNQVNNYR
jgi:hypothetical protein